MPEVRAKDPVTGGEKGRKEQTYSMLPWESLGEIARVYNYGANKYARDNWRKGYPWSWSYDALIRHAEAFWRGEDLDGESGISHLAHAGFHVLALLWFRITGRGTDDRWKTQSTDAHPTGQQVPGADALDYYNKLVGTGDMEERKICASLSEAADQAATFGDFCASYDPITRTWIIRREVEKKKDV